MNNILIVGPKSNVEIMAFAQTVSHIQGKNYVLLNTTDTKNCPEFYDNPGESNKTFAFFRFVAFVFHALN